MDTVTQTITIKDFSKRLSAFDKDIRSVSLSKAENQKAGYSEEQLPESINPYPRFLFVLTSLYDA